MTNDNERKSAQDVITIILNYVVYVVCHVLGMNYILTYILYQDAMENDEYIDREKMPEKINQVNILTSLILVYLILYIQQTILSCKYSRHILGVCITTQLTAFIYLNMVVNRLLETSCKYRGYLTCYESTIEMNLRNENMLIAKEMLLNAIYVCMVIQTLYIMCSIISNMIERKHYFHKNQWCELVSYYVFYMVWNVIVFIAPLLCCICCLTGGCQPDDDTKLDVNINWSDMIKGTTENITSLQQTSALECEIV